MSRTRRLKAFISRLTQPGPTRPLLPQDCQACSKAWEASGYNAQVFCSYHQQQRKG